MGSSPTSPTNFLLDNSSKIVYMHSMTEYEVHYSLKDEDSLNRASFDTKLKKSVFSNKIFSEDGTLMRTAGEDFLLTDNFRYSSDHEAFLIASRVCLNLGNKSLRMKIETGPRSDAMYHEAHLKLDNERTACHILDTYDGWWMSINDNNGSVWLTTRSRDIQTLRAKYRAIYETFAGSIIERDIESVILDTNLRKDHFSGWGLF